MGNKTILKANSISKSFGTQEVLSNIHLSIKEGEILALMGASGAGKSTLLRTLAGLEALDKGYVAYEGEELEKPEDSLVPGHEELQYVAQDFKLLKNRTVLENVKEALLAYNEEFTGHKLEYLLDTLKLYPLVDKRIELLSGGEKQRLAIARAMATEPAVLLLDEPFTQLDQINRGIIINSLRKVNKELATTIVFVTHQPEEVFHLADRVGLLVDAELRQIASPQEVYQHPADQHIAQLFGPINFLNSDLLSKIGISIRSSKTYGIRPQYIKLLNKARKNTVKVNIQSIQFNGSYWKLELGNLDLKDQTLIIHSYEPVDYPKGEELHIKLKQNKILIWE